MPILMCCLFVFVLMLPTPAVAQTSCDGAPAPLPPALTVSVSGQWAFLAWDAQDGVTQGFRVEAGSAPGASNVRVFSTIAQRWSLPVANGSYWVRVWAESVCGGPATVSSEWAVTVPCHAAVPALAVAGQTVTWTGGTDPAGYRLEIALEPGAPAALSFAVAGAGSFTFGGFGTGATGTYYARLRGASACGGVAVSPEATVRVP